LATDTTLEKRDRIGDQPVQDLLVSAGIVPYFQDAPKRFVLLHGDSVDLLGRMPANCVDMIFADPPYFLSNDGITCHAGKMVSVNKGDWDRSQGPDANHEFNRQWLAACQRVLKPHGTLWVSGTSHVIHSVGFAMQQLGFKLLNDISWVKPNPPPNLSCRYFTHATETIIWAAKNRRSKHKFNYQLMKEMNGGKQMQSVWRISALRPLEKRFGKHPAQKPLILLERVLFASTAEGDVVLDPFMGSGTTAIAALRLGRQSIAIDRDGTYVDLALKRYFAETLYVAIVVQALNSSLDLRACFVDRSGSGSSAPKMAIPSKLVHRERKYFFVGVYRREVIYSVAAESLEDAWRQFRASVYGSEEVISVIKTETEIYLAR
jgi:site-specific DNA-methyltransferase (adenine-specific)